MTLAAPRSCLTGKVYKQPLDCHNYQNLRRQGKQARKKHARWGADERGVNRLMVFAGCASDNAKVSLRANIISCSEDWPHR